MLYPIQICKFVTFLSPSSYWLLSCLVAYRPTGLTKCCIQFRSLGVKVLCVFHLYDNIAFTFKWYGSTWNVLFPKDLNWVQHWVSRIGLLNLFRGAWKQSSSFAWHALKKYWRYDLLHLDAARGCTKSNTSSTRLATFHSKQIKCLRLPQWFLV